MNVKVCRRKLIKLNPLDNSNSNIKLSYDKLLLKESSQQFFKSDMQYISATSSNFDKIKLS